MVIKIIYMDNFAVAFSDYTRHFPAAARLRSLGHIAQKHDVVDHDFASFNFSLILEGEGFFGWQGQEPMAVKAPCVITQWPGTMMHYGAHKGKWWRELYLIYGAEDIAALTRAGFINPQRRWWMVENIAGFEEAVSALLGLAQQADKSGEAGIADRVDRAAERAVLESLLPGPLILSKNDHTVLRIKRQLEEQCKTEHDLDDLALRHGLSPSVFRRHWKKLVGMPPHRYIIEQRMIRARKLLASSALNVSEIAFAVGYDDPLYFSRLFHKTTGISASVYRRYYRPGDKTKTT